MKAVVMAGGEGSRLRPLTCDLPKPLARVCGKPVLTYIFDLLIRHGFSETAITLGYLANMLEEAYPNGMYRQLNLSFVREDSPLGTAGGVANAARGWDEPFLVISGDAMCDFDLSAFHRAHIESGAAVTIAGYQVEDPREYGLLSTDAQGYVNGFIEKPAWGQATSNLANTGIYFIRPDVLHLIPQDGRPFDFAKDLFPLLLEQGQKIFCSRCTGYWCDIGDLEAYRQCAFDILELVRSGKGSFAIPASKAAPAGVQVLEPVYIGEEVELAPGSEIGPNVVLDTGCSVGESAKVRGSVLLQNVSVSNNAALTGAIICAGAALRRGASLFEGSAVGAGSIIGAFASIQPKVLVWPHKQVESHAVLRENLKYGNGSANLFDDGGVGGEDGILLTPECCTAIGAAIGSVKSCKKVGIACDGSNRGKALLHALAGGLMGTGCHVWSFGECFEAQLNFFTGFCGLALGIFVVGEGEAALRVCGEGGLSAPRYLEREIEAKLRRAEFHHAAPEECKDMADMGSIRMMYAREICKLAPDELKNMSCEIRCQNRQIRELLNDCLARLNAVPTTQDADFGGQEVTLVFEINASGTALRATEEGTPFTDEQLLALCCQVELEEGNDLALPYDAPEILDALAANAGKCSYRYLSSPADQSDSAARRLSAKQLWVRDALFRMVRVLAVMKEKKSSLRMLVDSLPRFYVEHKQFRLPCAPSLLKELFGEQDAQVESAKEGIVLRKESGRLLITPSKNGKNVRVFAEAADYETANELCIGIEDIL
jgi:mannose-1-phosphate guanylyltransferase/phosphomannomutase